jgi:opacity protein-like surface antigen
MLMKKALLIALTLGLICAWTVPAMAIDWIVFGGFTVKNVVDKNIDFRNPTFMGGIPGSWRITGSESEYPGFVTSLTGTGVGLPHNSNPTLDPAWNRVSWFLQMRGDIYVVARASADLQGVFGIEVNSTRFGDADATYMPYALNSGVASGKAGRWNADAIAVQVKSMYIDFKVPALPVRLKVGIQPFQLRNNVFLYVDAAGISGNIKIPAGDMIFNINPFWAKVYGNGPFANATTDSMNPAYVPSDYTTADDGNFFGVDLNAVIGDIKPGVFFAMQRLGRAYDLKAGIVTPAPWFGGVTPAGSTGDSNQWWLGTYLDATIGPVTVNADFIYNGGFEGVKSGFVNFNNPAGPFTGTNNILYYSPYGKKHEAFLGRGQVSLNANKLTIGLGALYGTGDNPTTRNKDEGYHVPFNSEAAFFNNDFVVLTGDWGLREPFGSQNSGGLFKPWSDVGQGVWYVRAFADYQVVDWLKVKANVGYIGDTVSHGDEFSTDSWFIVTPTGVMALPQVDKGSNSIGWELDAGVQINIYKNLFLDTAFGYIIGGKALLSQYGGYRAQDPWTLETVLTYQF